MKNNSSSGKGIRAVIAIFLALFLWFYVNGSSTDLITQDINNIPVSLTNTDTLAAKGLAVDNSTDYYINIKIRGSEKNLESVDPTQITAEIDLSEIKEEGTFSPKITVSGLPYTVAIETMKPEEIQLKIVKITDQEQTVKINTSGKPADDLTVISVESDQKVKLSGSTEDLAKVKSVNATANVQGLKNDSVQFVEVHAVDENGNVLDNVECEPREIKAEITLGVTKTVKVNAPNVVGTVEDGYEVTGVSVSPSTVLIGGKEDVLKDITSVFVSDISVEGASNSITEECSIVFPDNVTDVGEQSKVEVTVSIEPLIEKSYTVDTIEDKNVPSDLTVSKQSSSTVTIKVKGTAKDLEDMNISQISAWVDLSNETEGKVEVPVQVSVPKGTVTSISPKNITVTLKSK